MEGGALRRCVDCVVQDDVHVLEFQLRSTEIKDAIINLLGATVLKSKLENHPLFF